MYQSDHFSTCIVRATQMTLLRHIHRRYLWESIHVSTMWVCVCVCARKRAREMITEALWADLTSKLNTEVALLDACSSNFIFSLGSLEEAFESQWGSVQLGSGLTSNKEQFSHAISGWSGGEEGVAVANVIREVFVFFKEVSPNKLTSWRISKGRNAYSHIFRYPLSYIQRHKMTRSTIFSQKITHILLQLSNFCVKQKYCESLL